ncbi:MAG TPA: hypothetical protein VIV11_42815 [Kofleriaceae bacterium]
MPTFFQRLFPTRAARTQDTDPDHAKAIARTAGMVHDKDARSLANKHALQILDLTWEDTGRFKGSCVGPNISDMTIQVSQRDGDATRITCMPVIRFPNFSDKTADVTMDDVFLRVGNERGRPLRRVSLRDYLRDLRAHLNKPSSWAGRETSLLAPREKDVLVSAQACFLPVPTSGKAEFNPVLFNYQSYSGAPAVLAIVATREGTSATIIDNTRDGFGAGTAWGQRLFFNQDGERASFTGTRMTEFVAGGGDANDQVDSKEAAAGLNCVMLIQVPLVQPERARYSNAMLSAGAPMAMDSMARSKCAEAECDIDEAVIGHGEAEGPFTEIDGLAIKRDPRFPIRITVQFYKATSNGVVCASEMKAISDQINAVYADAKAVGSLVTEPDRGRSTEWDDEGHGKAEPADWWEQFWRKQEAATGKTREELMRQLELLLGRKPNESELEAALRRVFKA